MKVEEKTITTLVADDGKILVNKYDKRKKGTKITLGYYYYDKTGIALSEPVLETEDDYEEIDKPEGYNEGLCVDPASRLIEGVKLLKRTEEELESLKNKMNEELSNINLLNLDEQDAIKLKDYYPKWKEGLKAIENSYYVSEDNLWKCVKSHITSQSNKPSTSKTIFWSIVLE